MIKEFSIKTDICDILYMYLFAVKEFMPLYCKFNTWHRWSRAREKKLVFNYLIMRTRNFNLSNFNHDYTTNASEKAFISRAEFMSRAKFCLMRISRYK